MNKKSSIIISFAIAGLVIVLIPFLFINRQRDLAKSDGNTNTNQTEKDGGLI